MFPEIPEISVQELAEKLKTADKFTILDVREPWELDRARVRDKRLINLPVSELERNGLEALPQVLRSPETELVVICHHGIRSGRVTRWLRQQGWQNVFSLAGGLAAFAKQIDPSVGSY